MNTYVEEVIARARLEEARAHAETQHLIATFAPARPALRRAIGLALIRAGRRLASEARRRAPEAGRLPA
jgi:hypothetical protein